VNVVPTEHPLLSQAAGGSPHLLAALLPVVLLLAAFDVYCLVDLIRVRSVRYLPKVLWAVVIVVVSAPVGGVLYLFLGRDRDGAGGGLR
jgi:hypothetical protein